MDRAVDPADHRKGACGTAEFRRLAAQRCVFRRPWLADDLGATLLSRLLAAPARRAHPALGHRGGAWHHGGAVFGFWGEAARLVGFFLRARSRPAQVRL